MKIIDLTHRMENGMPVYPESEPPRFAPLTKFEEVGYRETDFHISSHIGTHIDAPAHLCEHGATLDEMDVERFMGSAYVLDVSDLAGRVIPMARLQTVAHEIDAVDFLLFYTGWGKRWGEESYFEPFPVLTLEAAEYLARFPLKGVGIDAFSLDPMTSTDYPIHKILLGAGFVNTENLCDLEELAGKSIGYMTLPLHFKNADGSPVRAVALVD